MTGVKFQFYFASQANLCKAASLLLHLCNVQTNVFWWNESSLQDSALKERRWHLKLFYLTRHNVKEMKITTKNIQIGTPLQRQSGNRSLVLITIRNDFYIKAFNCDCDTWYTQNPHDSCPVKQQVIKSVGANYTTNQYTSSSKMLSGTSLVPFSHSLAVNSPYDKINGAIQNNEFHDYVGQSSF